MKFGTAVNNEGLLSFITVHFYGLIFSVMG
jgi:hypothetical protein